MPKDVVGSIRKVTIEGIPFRATADANISRKPVNVETTMIATSGKAMQKKTKVVPVAEGVVLAVNGDEMEVIKSFEESLEPNKLSYETAAGAIYRCIGKTSTEAHESEEGKANMTFQPQEDWTYYPA